MKSQREERPERIGSEFIAFKVAVLYNKSDIRSARKGVKLLAKNASGGRMRLDKLLAMLGWQLRRLFFARLCLDAGRDGAYLSEALAMHSDYAMRRLTSSAKRFSLERLTAALKLCFQSDLAMKSGSDGEDVLKLMFVRLAAGYC